MAFGFLGEGDVFVLHTMLNIIYIISDDDHIAPDGMLNSKFHDGSHLLHQEIRW